MPTIEWNKAIWDGQYNWEQRGEEWSVSWGNSEAQWFGSLLPRVHRHLPCERILEIACGYGRWTKFLLGYTTKNFTAIDLSGDCIANCQKSFNGPNIRFFQNDGFSLGQVADQSYDFVFSFDSLVHADPQILDAYIRQIIPLLSINGTCFLHHSNFGAIVHQGMADAQHPGYLHNRDPKSTASDIKNMILKHHGKILCQEIIDWGGGAEIDCLTTFCAKEAFKHHQEIQISNAHFMLEAKIICKIQSHYSTLNR